ncbi:MAG: bifunctional DNA-formamidopyrimidine glycosylase/DNA-(apurinic or apyrimidinic site) lyase [Gemmatimonadaceae bacterium]
MPELPEVEAAMEVLRARAQGRSITHVQVLHPALHRRLSPSQLAALVGARIARVERRGKHQLLHLDDGRILHAHFRMNGDWELVKTGAPLPRFARAVLEFDDGSSLVFVDSRALGTIDLHPAGAVLDLGLGPDAADPMWTAAQLSASLAGKRAPIKPALLDQRLVAGLGNIYAAESLWRARISPRLSCDALTSAQVNALRKAIAAVIQRATGSRYTDDDTVALDVYDREGLPCRRCRSSIARVVQVGRSTYYCPLCQSDPVATKGASRATDVKRSTTSKQRAIAKKRSATSSRPAPTTKKRTATKKLASNPAAKPKKSR